MKKLLYLSIILLLTPLLFYGQKKTINELGVETIIYGDNVKYVYDGNPFNDNKETLFLTFHNKSCLPPRNSRYHPSDCRYIEITKSDLYPLKITSKAFFGRSMRSTGYPINRYEFIFDNDRSTYFKLTESRYKKIKSLDDELFLKFKKHKNFIMRVSYVDQNGVKERSYGDKFFNLKGMQAGFNKFNGVKAPSIKNKNSYAVVNGLANVNPFNLEKYIDLFILDAKKNHNVDLSYVNKRDRLIIFRELEGQTIAAAYKMNDDNNVLVLVDPENWYDANQAKRWYIIYHELGHDILNLKHGECGAMMNESTSGSYTWGRLEKDKNTMFNAYKKKK